MKGERSMFKVYNKKIFNIVVTLLSVFWLVIIAGCGSDVKNEQLSWTINVQECQVRDKLEVVDDVRQYDGSIAKVPHNNAPAAGNVFLLVKLEAKKNIAGNHPLQWQAVVLQDSKGNSYNRVQDVFLTDYKYDRLSATDLKLDSNGWVCFEIPTESVKDGMKLVYTDGDRKNVMIVKP